MVSWLIQKKYICTGDHQLAEHAADFLTTGQNADFLYTVLAGEQHTSQESADISRILDLGILSQPVNDGIIIIEFLGIVLREIGLRSSNTPFVSSFIRFQFTCKDTEQRSLRKFIATYKCNFVVMAKDKGYIVQNLYTIDGFGQSLYGQNLVTDLAIRPEVNVRIFTTGRTNLIQLNFFQSFLSGSCLLGFGSICRETGDEFLQLFDLLFLFLVCWILP